MQCQWHDMWCNEALNTGVFPFLSFVTTSSSLFYNNNNTFIYYFFCRISWLQLDCPSSRTHKKYPNINIPSTNYTDKLFFLFNSHHHHCHKPKIKNPFTRTNGKSTTCIRTNNIPCHLVIISASNIHHIIISS